VPPAIVTIRAFASEFDYARDEDACLCDPQPQFFGRRHLGSIQGVLQTSNVASTAIGPLIIGGAHELSGQYDAILLTLAAMYAIGSVVIYLFLRTPKRAALIPSSHSCELAETAAPHGDETARVAVAEAPATSVATHREALG
jgi:hypothetical protein